MRVLAEKVTTKSEKADELPEQTQISIPCSIMALHLR